MLYACSKLGGNSLFHICEHTFLRSLWEVYALKFLALQL